MGNAVSKLSHQIFEAAIQGNEKVFFESLKSLVKETSKPESEVLSTMRDPSPNAAFKSEDTILHAACRNEHRFDKKAASQGCLFENKVKIVKYLIETKVFDINHESAGRKHRPLDYACLVQNPSELLCYDPATASETRLPGTIVELLLQEGADFTTLKSNIADQQKDVEPNSLATVYKKEVASLVGFQAEEFITYTDEDTHKNRTQTPATFVVSVDRAPLLCAVYSGFSAAVPELVGRGAKADLSLVTRETCIWFACEAVRFGKDCCDVVQMLQSLLAVTPSNLLAQPNVRLETPLAVAIKHSAVYPELGDEVVKVLLKNNVNFYNEFVSLAHALTEPKNFTTTHCPSLGLRILYERNAKDWKRAIPSDFIRKLFFEHDAFTQAQLDKDAENRFGSVEFGRYPIRPCFNFHELNWNNNDHGSLFVWNQLGRSSLLAASILLMKFELFKHLLLENGFNALLKPIRLRRRFDEQPIPTSSPYKDESGRPQPLRVSIVPLYLLFAAGGNGHGQNAARWIQWIFDNCPQEFRESFSCFQDYADAKIFDYKNANGSTLDYSKHDSKAKPHITEKHYRCVYDFTVEHGVENIHMRLETNDQNFLTFHSFSVTNCVIYQLFMNSSRQLLPFIREASFFANLLPGDVKRFLSVYKQIKFIQLHGPVNCTLDVIKYIAGEYCLECPELRTMSWNANSSHILLGSKEAAAEQETSVEVITRQHFVELIKSKTLCRNLGHFQVDDCSCFFEQNASGTGFFIEDILVALGSPDDGGQPKGRMSCVVSKSPHSEQNVDWWKRFVEEEMKSNPKLANVHLQVAALK